MAMKSLICVSALALAATTTSAAVVDDRVYTWRVADYYTPRGFAGSDGSLQGIDVELMNAVCDAADVKCEAMPFPASACWANNYGGDHLVNGVIDGCMGFTITTARARTFNLIKYGPGAFSQLIIPTGTTVNYMNTDVSAKPRILFRSAASGAWYNFAAFEAAYPSAEVEEVPCGTDTECMAQLANGDAEGFWGESTSALPAGYERVAGATVLASDAPTLTGPGASVMLRKDNYQAAAVFDLGLKRIIANGVYAKIVGQASIFGEANTATTYYF